MKDSFKRFFFATCRQRLVALAAPLVLIFSSTPTWALEQNTYPFNSTADAQRFAWLTKEIRCVVCQNQNIADSTAPLANDLRTKVYHLVIEKKSNAEIKNYLVQRYGEFILLEPRFNHTTFILWMFPLLAGCIAGFILRRTIKKKSL